MSYTVHGVSESQTWLSDLHFHSVPRTMLHAHSVIRSCLTLYNPMDCTLQASPSMGFSRQEYWSGLSFPSPGHLPDPGTESTSPALQRVLYCWATREALSLLLPKRIEVTPTSGPLHQLRPAWNLFPWCITHSFPPGLCSERPPPEGSSHSVWQGSPALLSASPHSWHL